MNVELKMNSFYADMVGQVCRDYFMCLYGTNTSKE